MPPPRVSRFGVRSPTSVNSRRTLNMKNFPKIRTLVAGSLFTLAIAVLVSVASLPAFGQAITGTLRGTVTDPNGGVISGATVTAKHQGTGVSFPTTSNGEGLYVIPNLPPGNYTVTV